MTDTSPAGAVVLINNPKGATVVSVADFQKDKPGGFSLHDAQLMRARRDAKASLLRVHLNGWLAGAADQYFQEMFWENAKRAGYVMQEIKVGGDD